MVIHINDANSDTDDVYIGSTNYAHLSKRYWRHRRDGYDPKTKHRYGKIFETDNHKIECLEQYPCKNKEELRTRERYWIEQHPTNINSSMPILHPEEKKKLASDNQKKWYATENGKAKKKISNQRFIKNNPNYYKNLYQKNKELKGGLTKVNASSPFYPKGFTISVEFN